jgi:hypothetical protein
MIKHLSQKHIITSSLSVDEYIIIIKGHHVFKVEGGVQERIVANDKGQGGGPGISVKRSELRA